MRTLSLLWVSEKREDKENSVQNRFVGGLCLDTGPCWGQRQLLHRGFPEVSAAGPTNKPSTRVKDRYGEK